MPKVFRRSPERPHSLADAAARYGYSRQRASQIRRERGLGVEVVIGGVFAGWAFSPAELDAMAPGRPGRPGRPRKSPRTPAPAANGSAIGSEGDRSS